jgi:predicted nucleotidyltransferase
MPEGYKKFDALPDPELKTILKTLTNGMQSILGDNFLGAYLGGSFAHGGWHAYSDVDFDVVIERDLTPADLTHLKVLHARIFTIESYWARHLEGAYFPRQILSDLVKTDEPLWYLDNGSLNFERSTHDNTLVNRWVLRERGVILAGPQPKMWIPPIPGAQLRQEVWQTMRDWHQEILRGDYAIDNRFNQIFTVLMYCRMLHSLETGEVRSKPAGAAWAKSVLDPQWVDLIDDALSAVPNQYEKIYQVADPLTVQETYAFMRYAVDLAKSHWGMVKGDFR